MSLNDTPSANRIHLGFFGKRNAGKSSLVNALTGQELSVVSDIKGTTTDPVSKSMELLPLGPVLIIDTPGIDDDGALGTLRIQKTRQILGKTDIAVLVIDAACGETPEDTALLKEFRAKKIPFLIAYNKCDTTSRPVPENGIPVSARTRTGIRELKEKIAALAGSDIPERKIVADLIRPSELVVLVTPIDSAAPKGRLILPQQQTIRDILDANAFALVVKETELQAALAACLQKPALVITDSQVFRRAAHVTPEEIPLTSFSILMARYKGFLDTAVRGVAAVKQLHDGDTVLIAEGCTHHRQCEDIGTVKIPRWLRESTGKELHIETASGADFPEDINKYSLIIHCGGCMLNEREVQRRMNHAESCGIPFTNYGILIAYLQGILHRSLRIFPHLLAEIEE